MNEYRTKISANGRILIPAQCRKQLHFTPSSPLILRVENNELRLFSLEQSLKKAQTLVQKYAKNQSLVKKFKKMREEDAENE